MFDLFLCLINLFIGLYSLVIAPYRLIIALYPPTTIRRPKISPPKVIYKVQSMPYKSLPLGAFWTIFGRNFPAGVLQLLYPYHPANPLVESILKAFIFSIFLRFKKILFSYFPFFALFNVEFPYSRFRWPGAEA